ncbi:hypothetical protein CRENBAI_024807 [Crenichthys baileyi]|uniref:Transmembrane protein n=1 Tax=Crenichthys baileyi TaxID=28760 RepID=A0AAV9REJ1_9TELE
MGVLAIFNPLLPETKKNFSQPHPMTKKKKLRMDYSNNKQTNNCFLQYFFFYSFSCFFFLLLLFFFRTSKLESSVAPHTASFFKTCRVVTLYGILHECYKRILRIQTMRIYCLFGKRGVSPPFLLSVGFLSFLLKNTFCFSLCALNDIPPAVPSFSQKIKRQRATGEMG